MTCRFLTSSSAKKSTLGTSTARPAVTTRARGFDPALVMPFVQTWRSPPDPVGPLFGFGGRDKLLILSFKLMPLRYRRLPFGPVL